MDGFGTFFCHVTWTVIIGITMYMMYRYSWYSWIVHVLYVDVKASLNLSSPLENKLFVSTSDFLCNIWLLFPSHLDVRPRWKRWNFTQHHGKKAINNTVGRSHGYCTVVPQQRDGWHWWIVPLARILGYFGLATSPTKAFSQFCRRSMWDLVWVLVYFFCVWTIRYKRGMVGQLDML